MSHHSRITKVQKLLRKLLKCQEERKAKWLAFNHNNTVPDYDGRRGWLLCYFPEDYPKNRSKSKTLQFPEDQLFWNNFDLPVYPLLEDLSRTSKFSDITSSKVTKKKRPFAPQHLIPQKSKASLGIYMQHLVKYLGPRKPKDPDMPSTSKRNAVKKLLSLLEEKLCHNTAATDEDKCSFLQRARLVHTKRNYLYPHIRRGKVRKSAHPIQGERAESIIRWLIQKTLSENAIEAAVTLLYVWIALQASHAKVKTSVAQILSLLPFKDRKKAHVIAMGYSIYFGEKELVPPRFLISIINALTDARSKESIFQSARPHIEDCLHEANIALGYADKEPPLTPETFLRFPFP